MKKVCYCKLSIFLCLCLWPMPSFAQEEPDDGVGRFLLYLTIVPLSVGLGSVSTATMVTSSSGNHQVLVRKRHFKRYVKNNPSRASEAIWLGMGEGFNDFVILFNVIPKDRNRFRIFIVKRRKEIQKHINSDVSKAFVMINCWKNRSLK